MWLGWEPVVKITVPLEWTLFTVINAVAWGSQQRAQLLQRPWWCCRFPSSLWVTSISNTEIRAQLYICFVSGGHTIQHSLLPALRYNFFYLFEYICWKEKAADQKLLFCLRHTPARFFHMCVTHYIIYCLYLLITLLHECIQWCNTHKKSKSNPGSMHAFAHAGECGPLSILCAFLRLQLLVVNTILLNPGTRDEV